MSETLTIAVLICMTVLCCVWLICRCTHEVYLLITMARLQEEQEPERFMGFQPEPPAVVRDEEE